jgi:hypothetical protein
MERGGSREFGNGTGLQANFSWELKEQIRNAPSAMAAKSGANNCDLESHLSLSNGLRRLSPRDKLL